MLTRKSFRVYIIPSEAMEPTLMGHEKGISPTGDFHSETVHDKVMVEREAYRDASPHHGDIIAFRAPKSADKWAELKGDEPKEQDFIKRIIGLPGDTIEINEDAKGILRVFRNGSALAEPYISAPMMPNPGAVYGTSGPLKLGANELFVMGDNRNNSNDSRFWGPLTRARIIGKVTAILSPESRAREFE